MSLEDFAREVAGKPPKNRGIVDRMPLTDEDGCSYDQQVMVGRLPLGLGAAFFLILLTVAWASGDPAWTDLTAKLGQFVDLLKSIAGAATT